MVNTGIALIVDTQNLLLPAGEGDGKPRGCDGVEWKLGIAQSLGLNGCKVDDLLPHLGLLEQSC